MQIRHKHNTILYVNGICNDYTKHDMFCSCLKQVKDLKDLLTEFDEDNNGSIDFSEFEAAMNELDNTIIRREIEAIYDLMSGNNIHNFLD